jgi:hypothetical protein
VQIGLQGGTLIEINGSSIFRLTTDQTANVEYRSGLLNNLPPDAPIYLPLLVVTIEVHVRLDSN